MKKAARDENGREPGAIAKALTGLLACSDLPEAPPDDPMPLLAAWYEEAERSGKYDDFNAVALATASPEGAPSVRIVLCKAIEASPPAVVFYTSYASRKGRELEANPRAAAVFHWTHAKRQARVEGKVQRVSEMESDAYFRTRPLLSRIGAAASHQSSALASRAQLLATAMRIAREAGVRGDVERPHSWGGFRIFLDRVELWSAREGRLHDRVQWERRSDGTWSVQRLSA